MHPRRTAIPATLLLFLSTACSGKLVGEQAAGANGALAWTTKVPPAQTASLWLAFELESPAVKKFMEDKLEMQYRFAGTLAVTSGEKKLYDGPLVLANDDYPLRGQSSKTTTGSSRFCNTAKKRCELGATVWMMDLEGVSAGAPLTIAARLPMTAGDAKINSFKVQLRAK